VSAPRRVLLVCPGRGSYGRRQLGCLPTADPIIRQLDAYRTRLGRPTLSELDRAERFISSQHMAGEHASLLTFGATAVDLAALDPAKARIVAVTGNSMGWYTALYAAGALGLADAARLIETMGAWQAQDEHGVIGGQVMLPTVGEDWRPDPVLQARVAEALTHAHVHLSIRLGGTTVLGASRDGVRWLLDELPKQRRGSREFPLQLPLHSAFHTPLLAATSARAIRELGDLPLRPPAHPLFAGDGRSFRAWADPFEVLDYTLGHQVVAPYDLTLAVQTAVGTHAPELLVLPGPGDTLGAPVAQILIAMGWRGLRDRADFDEAQGSDAPLIAAMARPAQRAWVA